MSLFTALAFFLIILSVVVFFSRSKFKGLNKRIPPLANGAWPIVGHLPMLRGSKTLLHSTFASMSDTYGPIFSISLGVRQAVVINTWQLAKECYTRNDLAVSTRPQHQLAVKYLGYDGAMFAFAPYGMFWREMRKISTLQLLSNHRLELLKHVRSLEVEASIKELRKKWSLDSRGSSSTIPVMVEINQCFSDISYNIIVRMVAGKRYFGSSAGSEEARRCKKALSGFFYLLGILVIGDAVPVLKWLDLGGHEKDMRETSKELDSIAQGWLDDHKRRQVESRSCKEGDFMDILLKLMNGAKFEGYDSDTIIKATSLALIAGGSDTTSITITWALSLLLNNRQALKKAQAELDTHIGKERLVNQSDMPKLNYLQAIVKETLRLYPATPLSGPRMVNEDCTIGGYDVPKGTRLITNLHKIHRDPHIWGPDPSEFRPERFLSTQKDIVVEGKGFELIPFGAGRRSCPGSFLGLQVVHLVLASFLHAFEFSTPSDAPVDMTESSGMASSKAEPLSVLIAPRLPHHVYDELRSHAC